MAIGRMNTPAMCEASRASATTGMARCHRARLDRRAALAAASRARSRVRKARNTDQPFRQRGHETAHCMHCPYTGGRCPVWELWTIWKANKSSGADEYDQPGSGLSETCRGRSKTWEGVLEFNRFLATDNSVSRSSTCSFKCPGVGHGG